jgi:parallel beta-helix repeat protein
MTRESKRSGYGRNSLHYAWTLLVNQVNVAPTITLPEAIELPVDETTTVDFSPFLSDFEGDALTLAVTGNTHLGVTIEGTQVTFVTSDWEGSEVLTFMVDDNAGGTAQDIVTIRMYRPSINFTTDSQLNNMVVAGDASMALLFTPILNFTATWWAWDFQNDGSDDSNAEQPSYVYDTPGTWSVKLTVGDDYHTYSTTRIDFVTAFTGVQVPETTVTEDWTWTEEEGPYNITGQVDLRPDVTLQIMPGTQVNLLADSTLVINGSIQATDANFTVYGENGWAGIRMTPQSQNCVLDGLTVQGAATAFTLDSCSPTIRNTTLTGAVHPESEPTTAIRVEGTAAPILENLHIEGFDKGIIADNTSDSPSNLTIRGSQFQRPIPGTSPEPCVQIRGRVNTHLDDLRFHNYPKGVSIGTMDEASSDIVVITNVRVRLTENSRTDGFGIELLNCPDVTLTADSLGDCRHPLVIDNSGLTTPGTLLVENSAIVGGTDTDCGIRIEGPTQATILGTQLTNCVAGIRDSSATLADLVISDVTLDGSPLSRTPGLGLKIAGRVSSHLDNLNIRGFTNGIEVGSLAEDHGDIVVITNVRVRLTENSTRDPGCAIRLLRTSQFTLDADSLSADCGIAVVGPASGTISRTVFNDCTTGIDLNGSIPATLEGNTFSNCATGLSVTANPSGLTLSRNLFASPASTTAPAMRFTNAGNVGIRHATVYGSPAVAASQSTLTFENGIVWDASPLATPFSLTASTCDATYSDIHTTTGAYQGTGNINSDPLFADVEHGDLQLTGHSPCIVSGNPDSPYDPDDTPAEMGALVYDRYYQPLIPDFSVSTTTGTGPLVVHFTDTSTLNAAGWSWDFQNDGAIDSHSQNPVFTYLRAGDYAVSLTITDGFRSETVTRAGIVHVANANPIVVTPLSDMYLNTNFGSQAVSLGSVFSDPNGDALTYAVTVEPAGMDAVIVSGTLILVSHANWAGTATVTVTANDGQTTRTRDMSRENSRATVSDSFTVTVAAGATAPVNFRIAIDKVTSEVVLTWTAVPGASSYRLYLSPTLDASVWGVMSVTAASPETTIRVPLSWDYRFFKVTAILN